MRKVIVRMLDSEEDKLWNLTKDDCVYKCRNCGKEKEALEYSQNICDCGQPMTFRWWTDRSDIEFEDIK